MVGAINTQEYDFIVVNFANGDMVGHTGIYNAIAKAAFHQILKQSRGEDYKPRSKKVCYKCGKPGHFIAKCPLSSDSDRGDDKKGKRREKKRYYKKKGGDAHVCWEWDSDESFTVSSSDEDAANIAVTKGLLFPNIGHKCLMAKDAKGRR